MAGACRLRLGDYRVLFTPEDHAMRIFGVRLGIPAKLNTIPE
jgi:mRNA-degrading endonuclease RelE of RelBE toxin-antitoxin system